MSEDRQHYHVDPLFTKMSAQELHDAMVALGLDPSKEGDCRHLAHNLLLGKRGMDHVQDYLMGKREITGPISAAVRLWMALQGVGPAPTFHRGAPHRRSRQAGDGRGE